MRLPLKAADVSVLSGKVFFTKGPRDGYSVSLRNEDGWFPETPQVPSERPSVHIVLQLYSIR